MNSILQLYSVTFCQKNNPQTQNRLEQSRNCLLPQLPFILYFTLSNNSVLMSHFLSNTGEIQGAVKNDNCNHVLTAAYSRRQYLSQRPKNCLVNIWSQGKAKNARSFILIDVHFLEHHRPTECNGCPISDTNIPLNEHHNLFYLWGFHLTVLAKTKLYS